MRPEENKTNHTDDYYVDRYANRYTSIEIEDKEFRLVFIAAFVCMVLLSVCMTLVTVM